MKKTASRELTEDYLAFAEEEFTAGRLTRDVFNKAVLQVAAEFLIQHGDEVACVKTLYKVDPEYIKSQLKPDMFEDSLFATAMVEFVNYLEVSGITHEISIRPTIFNEVGIA
jgi:hypothetical protein